MHFNLRDRNRVLACYTESGVGIEEPELGLGMHLHEHQTLTRSTTPIGSKSISSIASAVVFFCLVVLMIIGWWFWAHTSTDNTVEVGSIPPNYQSGQREAALANNRSIELEKSVTSLVVRLGTLEGVAATIQNKGNALRLQVASLASLGTQVQTNVALETKLMKLAVKERALERALEKLNSELPTLPITSCKNRNATFLNAILDRSDAQTTLNRKNTKRCSLEPGGGWDGYIEQCCSLHFLESSGFGNQLLQLINAMRMARFHDCKVLCLPDCVSDHSCAESMWHGKGESVTETLNLPSTIVLRERLPGRPIEKPQIYQGAVQGAIGNTMCINGNRGPKKNLKEIRGGGWPYCFSRGMHGTGHSFDWAQAKADIAQFVAGRFKPLPEDELVIHLRTGDNLVQANMFYKELATQKQPETKPTCIVQPGCKAYVDAALHGYNGGPFRKVHVMADMRCAAGVPLISCATKHGDARQSCLKARLSCGLAEQYHHEETDKEAAFNPCLQYLLHKLQGGVVQLRPANLTNSEAFKYDTQLMIGTQNMATTCSTLSIFGRLTAAHLKRLFVPRCDIKHTFATKAAANRFHDTDQCKGLFLQGCDQERPYFEHAGCPGWSQGFLANNGRTFGADENLTITFYEFLWNEEPIIKAAFGPRVVPLKEWAELTNSVFGYPIPKLLTNVAFNKTTFNAPNTDSKPSANLPNNKHGG